MQDTIVLRMFVREATMASGDITHYDRDFLLSPAKRNEIIELWEVEKFGRDSFGDPDAVSLYGMRPAQWHAKGVRILARTALEAVRDPLGNRIGEDVARVAATAPPGSTFGVIDPFAGSCNGLFSILRHLPEAEGLGCVLGMPSSLGVRVPCAT
jgi:hypothetical protein